MRFASLFRHTLLQCRALPHAYPPAGQSALPYQFLLLKTLLNAVELVTTGQQHACIGADDAMRVMEDVAHELQAQGAAVHWKAGLTN